jgi:outer membrane receptor protein involved in Fe transport
VEGEFFYAPDDHWQFNLNFGHVNSAVGDFSEVDERNPTAGASNTVLVKSTTLDSSVGNNCVLYMTPLAGGLSPADNPRFQAILAASGFADLFFAPPGGSKVLASHGVPLANYGSCNPALAPLLAAGGYSETDPNDPSASAGGVPVDLHGNELQNTPPWTISIGAQYTFEMDGGYSLVPRVDFYWQDHMWGRIFEDPADSIKAYEITNAQITLNGPDSRWYVQGYVKNLFNETNETGEYLTSATSGLYTNAFLGDPRLYGIRLGARF